MGQHRLWGPEDAFAGGSQPKAQIDIVEVHREGLLVETAEAHEIGASHSHAGGSHGAHLAWIEEEVIITSVRAMAVIERVDRALMGTEHDPAMLHVPARPEEFR